MEVVGGLVLIERPTGPLSSLNKKARRDIAGPFLFWNVKRSEAGCGPSAGRDYPCCFMAVAFCDLRGGTGSSIETDRL